MKRLKTQPPKFSKNNRRRCRRIVVARQFDGGRRCRNSVPCPTAFRSDVSSRSITIGSTAKSLLRRRCRRTLTTRRGPRVTIPHTNKMLPVSGFDEQEYMFVSAYRRHFKLPKELKGQRIFVDFGGVMTAAKVFINGKSLGEYNGGYTPFSFELTNDINWNGRQRPRRRGRFDRAKRHSAVWESDRLSDFRRHLSRCADSSGAGRLYRKCFCEAVNVLQERPSRVNVRVYL